MVLVCTYTLDSPTVYATELPTKTVEKTTTEKDLSAAEKRRIEVAKIYQEHKLIESSFIWQPKQKAKEKELDFEAFQKLLKILSGFGDLIGYIFWLLLIALVIWVASKMYMLKGGVKFFSKRKIDNTVKQTVEMPVFLSNVEKKNWPDDLLAAAEQANIEGNRREALTYLLRFSLQLAEQNTSVMIKACMTERECEERLINVLPQECHMPYRDLFRVWIHHAWAHQKVAEMDVMALIQAFRDMNLLGAKC